MELHFPVANLETDCQLGISGGLNLIGMRESNASILTSANADSNVRQGLNRRLPIPVLAPTSVHQHPSAGRVRGLLDASDQNVGFTCNDGATCYLDETRCGQ